MKYLTLVLAGALLSACTTSPLQDILADDDPSKPTAATKPVTYVPVTAGTVDYRPVEPRGWGEQNEQVMPKPEATDGEG